MGLPTKAFLYTVDQIAYMLGATEATIKSTHLHYEGREIMPCPNGKMLAHNIAPEGMKPDWRVAENEFIRWLRFKGFRVYNRTSVTR